MAMKYREVVFLEIDGVIHEKYYRSIHTALRVANNINLGTHVDLYRYEIPKFKEAILNETMEVLIDTLIQSECEFNIHAAPGSGRFEMSISSTIGGDTIIERRAAGHRNMRVVCLYLLLEYNHTLDRILTSRRNV